MRPSARTPRSGRLLHQQHNYELHHPNRNGSEQSTIESIDANTFETISTNVNRKGL